MRDFIIANILIFIKVANCNLLEPRASQNCIHKVSLYYISKPCGELVGQQHVHALPLLRQHLRSGHDWPHRKTTSIQRSIPSLSSSHSLTKFELDGSPLRSLLGTLILMGVNSILRRVTCCEESAPRQSHGCLPRLGAMMTTRRSSSVADRTSFSGKDRLMVMESRSK